MTEAEAVRLVLEEAKRYLGEAERPRGSNRSVRIDYWLAEVGLPPEDTERAAPDGTACIVRKPGAAWCAAFVHQVGRQALGAAWPCPRTASVHDPQNRWPNLVEWARKAEVLLEAAGPHPGDLFFVWNVGLGRYAHVGFVEQVAVIPGQPYTIRTIEGNTNAGGSREGWGVFRRDRKVGSGLACARWAALLAP